MAERRMLAKTIVTSDAFLDMPATSRSLYLLMCVMADDDGFVNAPKTIMRMSSATDDDMKMLIAKRFVLSFQSGVVVIKHWRIHNLIQKDRYRETQYLDEKSMLALDENKAYTEAVYPECIQPVSKVEPQVRLGNDRLGEDRLGEDSKGQKSENSHTLFERLLPDYVFSELLAEKLREWITYKGERKEPYKEQGLKAALRQIETACNQYGEAAVSDLIDDSMANGWRRIIFERLKRPPQQTIKSRSNNTFLDALEEGTHE